MRVYSYIILIAGIILLFQYFGVPTPSTKVLDIFDINNPAAIPLSGWFNQAYLIIAGLTVAGIVIGLYMRSSPESFLLLGYTATLFVLGLDLVSILIQLKSSESPWIFTLMSIALGPIIIGYVHAVLSWWGGKQ